VALVEISALLDQIALLEAQIRRVELTIGE
jgi:hypothetical protein